jgi:hypothetical protein
MTAQPSRDLQPLPPRAGVLLRRAAPVILGRNPRERAQTDAAAQAERVGHFILDTLVPLLVGVRAFDVQPCAACGEDLNGLDELAQADHWEAHPRWLRARGHIRKMLQGVSAA